MPRESVLTCLDADGFHVVQLVTRSVDIIWIKDNSCPLLKRARTSSQFSEKSAKEKKTN